jgi:KaiC/GvpD/RAD55 family RecA-like ATPase
MITPTYELPEIDAPLRAHDQVRAAIANLHRDPATLLRWPFPELDDLTGPLGAHGQVWFVCAFSGSGKTTFVASCIDLWRRQGKKVYVMPLETDAHLFRTALACMACEVYPGDALSGQLALVEGGEQKLAQVTEALREQARAPYAEQVMISEQSAINVHGLELGLMEAKAFGADIVIVDHIDHIADSGSKSMYEQSQRVNHAALEMARANDMLLLFTSQLNLESVRGGDHLSRYQPPREHHVLMGNAKRQIATGMLGLYRTIRPKREDETDQEYGDALKQARAGTLPVREVLDHTVMGVNAMKLRNYGAREGGRVSLGFDRGRVIPLAPRDHYQTHPRYGMRRVGGEQ